MKALAPWLCIVAACAGRTGDVAPKQLAGPPTTVAVVQPAPQPATPDVEASPSWIGARFDPASTKVLQVIAGAPAERGGLRVDDEVVTIDGRTPVNAADIVAQIRQTRAGASVAVVLRRDGAQLAITLTPEVRPDLLAMVRRMLEGKPAPEFAAQQLAGAYPTRLADLAGKVIIIDFWATWCGPCAITMPVLDAWQTKYGDRGLRIVGLSSEDAPVIQEFLASHPLSYSIGLDVDAKIARRYLLQAVPMLIIVDRTGVVRDVEIGAGGFDALEAKLVQLL